MCSRFVKSFLLHIKTLAIDKALVSRVSLRQYIEFNDELLQFQLNMS